MKTKQKTGFTLPVVLVSLTGMLILLGALLTIVTLERQTATAHVNIYRADLAAESALTEVRSLLAQETANDEYVVFNVPLEVAFDDNEDGTVSAEETVERNYPFLARQTGELGSERTYEYIPLYSTPVNLDTSTYLENPTDPFLPEGDEDRVSISVQPWEEPAVLGWRYITDEDDKRVARYAYWVEDTEAYIDPKLVTGTSEVNEDGGSPSEFVRANARWPRGADKGTWEWPENWPDSTVDNDDIDSRYAPPWPAPGLNPYAMDGEPRLNQMALYTIGDPEAFSDGTDFDDEVKDSSLLARTRDSLLAAFGVEAPLSRDEDGFLLDQEAQRVEMHFTAGNQSYEEQPLIPGIQGIRTDMVGRPKINLNEMLAIDRDLAVTEITNHINKAIPNFGTVRSGDFPEDYVSTLAANVLDYADKNDTPTYKEGSYRGQDSFPLVTEYLTNITFAWIDQPEDEGTLVTAPVAKPAWVKQGGRTYFLFTVEVFAEFWNMSNQRLSGNYQMNYDLTYNFPIGLDDFRLDDPDILENDIVGLAAGRSGSRAIPKLQERDANGEFFFDPKPLTLAPNEYKLEKVGVVRYILDVGDESYIVEPNFKLDQIDSIDFISGYYKLKWNGELVDQSRGGQDASDFGKPKDFGFRNTHTLGSVSGTYGEFGDFFTGMGDPRNSFYSSMVISENSYPQNYSPNRRNVRYGSIYDSPNHGPDKIYARVLPSEWPDGGHDSSFDLDGFHDIGGTSSNLLPDAPALLGTPPTDIEERKAPMWISNLGRFFSTTELGNVYDPIMWHGRGRVSSSTDKQWVGGTGDTVEALSHSGQISESSVLGGGNTLRIGRPEHERFATERIGGERPETQAVRMLDLFHVGDPFSLDQEDWRGDTVVREGHININTAPLAVLRAVMAGQVAVDPDTAIRDRRGRHDERDHLRIRTADKEVSPPRAPLEDPRTDSERIEEANVLANAVIEGRPYASLSEVVRIKTDHDGVDSTAEILVFGNNKALPNGNFLNWNDRASEEMFARLYNSSTVRSRNFKVHVIGQAIRELPGGDLQIQSTRRKEFQIFAKPEGRDASGSLKDGQSMITVINEKSK